MLNRRAVGKSLGREQMLKFAKKFGTPSGVTISKGLVHEYYDVFGKKWVFVSRSKGER